MPRGDGTGRFGRGQGTGRGTGRQRGAGRGRMGGSAANPGDPTSGPQTPMSGGGMGMGRGMGRGRGMGAGINAGSQPMQGPIMPQTPAGPGDPTTRDQEMDFLKAQAQQLEDQLRAINARLKQTEQGGGATRLAAVVDGEKCTACGLCQRVCPVGAITLDNIARIDRTRCTGCGQCVAECPQGALSLKKA